MKKTFFIILLMTAFCSIANAQKTTTYRYEDTQARALDMVSKGFVKPLVNEVSVDTDRGRMKFAIEMDKDFVEIDMKGDIVNVRSYGVFKTTEEWNCDVVVAPTFHLFTNDKQGYTLEVVGFAGTFCNWRTMTESDLDWIRLTNTDTDNSQQVEAVTKPTRTLLR